MKRLFLIACCALIAFASCTKPEGGASTKLTTPKDKEHHASFTLNDKKFDVPIKKGVVPKTVVVTSGGEFLLGFYDNDAAVPEKAPYKYRSGRFSLAGAKAIVAGLRFSFQKYGELLIKEGSGNEWLIDYIAPDGTTYSGVATTSGDKISGVMADNVCRSWKPATILVSASGGNITNAIVGKKFSADLKQIFDFLKDGGMDIDNGAFAQYALESVAFTEGGLFIINFKNFSVSPFVGNFTLKENQEENISYKFDLAWVDNPLIPVTGTGTLTVTGTQLTLFTESDATVKGKTYHVSATIICEEIK